MHKFNNLPYRYLTLISVTASVTRRKTESQHGRDLNNGVTGKMREICGFGWMTYRLDSC